LPNKLQLDGSLWLAVQQHLYRGWGPILGGPLEILALITTVLLLAARRGEPPTRALTAVALAAEVAALVIFFIFNAPVNQAVAGWTAASLPADWPAYRLRWEAGHALAALASVIALATLVRAALIETRRRDAGRMA
jgi:uncharacterized membrane protein